MDTHPLLRLTVPAKVLPIATLLATSLLLQACGGPPQGSPPREATAAMTVTTTTVERSLVPQVVESTGSIEAWQDVIISAEVGGYRISQILVDVGSTVKKGQVLVRLSGDMLQADLDARRAALRSAGAEEDNATAALRRGESVANQGALSAADLDRLRADQASAAARVETARADLRTAELRAGYATVVAPDDGVITSRTVSVGQIAQAGTEMLRLLRQNRVEWQAQIPEAQMRLIEAGQSATLTTVDGTQLEGTVRTVSPTVQPTTRIGIAYVDITRGEARPGMFARGQVHIGQQQALLLPVASIVMQDGYSYVFVLDDDDHVHRRLVQPAGVHADLVQVAQGVEPGDTIAVKGAGFLKDGDLVQVAGPDAP